MVEGAAQDRGTTMNRRLIWLLLAFLLALIVALMSHSSVSSIHALITTTPSHTPPPSNNIYTVQAGDTLFAIGRRFQVNPYEIARVNHIVNPSVIHPGQRLTIPGSGNPSPGTTYTVQRGDNLYRIALRFGTKVDAIVAANKLSNRNLIYVGQQLTIPGNSGASSVNAGSGTPITPTPTPTLESAVVAAVTPVGVAPLATFPPYPTPTIKEMSSAFQPFEHGFMIWISDMNRIWVAVCCTSTEPQGGRWLSFEDAFVEGMPESDPSITPPEGLYQPVRGFGVVWRSLSNSFSGQALRDELGWATAPEQNYVAHVEFLAGGFFDPNGNFVGRPGTWTINTPAVSTQPARRYHFHEAGPAWSLLAQ